MNAKIIEAWEKNKDKIRAEIEKAGTVENYKFLVETILKSLDLNFGVEKIREIDDGHYQGTLIYIWPENIYQPDVNEYWFVDISYGSCSGCDTLAYIDMKNYDKKTQINEYMDLALHIVQKIKRLKETGEDDERLHW